MPILLTITRHTPDSCPMKSEKGRKVALEAAEKLEALAKKHGIKVVGMWSAPWAHLMVTVYDSPSLEAWQKFGMEPELMAWNLLNTTETVIPLTMQDTIKMIKRAQ